MEVRSSVHRLRQSIPPGEAALRRAFATWLQKVILPRFGMSLQEVSATLTLEELETMLAESIDRWNREIRDGLRRRPEGVFALANRREPGEPAIRGVRGNWGISCSPGRRAAAARWLAPG